MLLTSAILFSNLLCPVVQRAGQGGRRSGIPVLRMPRCRHHDGCAGLTSVSGWRRLQPRWSLGSRAAPAPLQRRVLVLGDGPLVGPNSSPAYDVTAPRHPRGVVSVRSRLAILGLCVGMVAITVCTVAYELVHTQQNQLAGGVVLIDHTHAPDLSLSDQFGAIETLSSLRGRPVVLALLDTSCADMCPVIAASLHETHKRLDSQVQQIEIVAVTVDPERDTPDNIRRLVVRKRSSEQLRSSSRTSSVQPLRTCSQLSRTIRTCRRRSMSASVANSGRPGCSRTPNAAATACGTIRASTRGANSVSRIPSSKFEATPRASSIARRDLPPPPGPRSVMRRAVSSNSSSLTAVPFRRVATPGKVRGLPPLPCQRSRRDGLRRTIKHTGGDTGRALHVR